MLAIIMSIALIMVGCGGVATIPQIGDKAPNFTLGTIEGDSLSLSDFRGKTVLLLFTGVNCKECEDQAPYVEAVYRESNERLAVLAIYRFNAPNKVAEYVSENKFTDFPALPDLKDIVATSYGLGKANPVNIFVNAEGIIKQKKVGPFQSQEEIENMLNSL